MNRSAPTELATTSVTTLLRMYAVPGIIAQTAASLYNMVDSIFIGHIPGVGSYAISGLAVTFPLMNLSVALGTLVGMGAMAMISILLGEKNYDKARSVLSNVLTLNTIIGFVFTLVSVAFLDPILRFFGASDQTLPFAHDYMVIILLGNIITHLFYGFNGLIRASGHPKTAMALTLFTVLSNAALDPIFIFVLGLGIRGAAIATVLCQAVALAYSLHFLSDKDNILHFPRPAFQLDWGIAKQSMLIGMGPFLMNSAACLVALMINQQLSTYGGDLAIGAYGIINRLTTIFVMICIGFNQGMQPIAGYNYGARKYSRVKRVFILTAKWETAVTILCFIISEFFPTAAVSIFTNDEELISIAAKGLMIMNAGIAFIGFGITSSHFFQCLGMVKISIFMSLSRQLLFLVPLIYLLPLWMGQKGVWISFPIADALSVLVAVIFITRLFRKFSTLHNGEDPSGLGGETV